MLDFLVLIDIITFWKKILLFKRTARQVDKRTGEIPNLPISLRQDELWYFSCPSCPGYVKITSDHLKSYL